MLRWKLLFSLGFLWCSLAASTEAQSLSWIGSSDNNWSNDSNWLPNGSAAGQDLMVGDIAAGQTIVDTDITISSLSLLNGATADTAGNQLTVDGVISVTGTDSTMIVPPRVPDNSLPAVQAGGVQLTSGGELTLAGGVLHLNDATSNVGNIHINSGGMLAGSGVVHLAESLNGTPTVTFFNDGEIRAEGGTLTLESTDPDHRLRTSGPGVLKILEDATLQLNIPVDTFYGDIILQDGATLEYSDSITLGEGSNIRLESSNVSNSDPSIVSDQPLSVDLGRINATGGRSVIDAPVQIGHRSRTTVESGAELEFTKDVFLAAGTLTGGGTLKFSQANITVAATQTINMSVEEGLGTVVMDGSPLHAENWQVDGLLILADGTLDDFGDNTNSEVDTITLNQSMLSVEQTMASEWTLAEQGLIILNGSHPSFEALRGDDILLRGRLEVTGDAKSSAKLKVAETGVIEIQSESNLILDHSITPGPHRMQGGSIIGAGTLTTDGVADLIGHGTIATDVDFPSNSAIVASGGTLQLTGQVLSAQSIGTNASGTLDLPNGIDTARVSSLSLDGGSVTGSFIANNGVTIGHGLISVDTFINNGTLNASTDAEEQLIVEAANGVDLDGALQVPGTVEATSGNLTIASSLTDEFDGQVTVGCGRTRCTLRFEEGWILGSSGTLTLSNGTLESDSSWLAGRVIAGYSRFSGTTTFATGASLEQFGSLTMELAGHTTMQSGVSFSLEGQIVNLAGATLVVEEQNLGTTKITNQGAFHFEGNLTMERYTQLDTGTIHFDISSPTQFDQFHVTNAFLDGIFELVFDPNYQPIAGDSYILITADDPVVGTFSNTVDDLPIIGGGLGWDLSYTSTEVILTVIATPLFGDFNGDNIVDLADYTVWRNNLGAATEDAINGSGDGLNGVDAADYLLWKQHFGDSLSPQASSQAVPEPGSLILALTLAGILASCQRWRHSSLPQRLQ